MRKCSCFSFTAMIIISKSMFNHLLITPFQVNQIHASQIIQIPTSQMNHVLFFQINHTTTSQINGVPASQINQTSSSSQTRPRLPDNQAQNVLVNTVSTFQINQTVQKHLVVGQSTYEPDQPRTILQVIKVPSSQIIQVPCSR